jgi:hypothetical protein
VEIITTEDGLLRRIVIHPDYIKPDQTITSFAFKPRKVDVDGLSVDLERLTTPEDAILDRTKFRLARLKASIPLSLGLACVHDPKADCPAHSLIQGDFTSSVRRQLALAATFVI